MAVFFINGYPKDSIKEWKRYAKCATLDSARESIKKYRQKYGKDMVFEMVRVDDFEVHVMKYE